MLCFDESLKLGYAIAASLKHVDGITHHCSVNVHTQQLCEQKRFHYFDLIVHFSPIIFISEVKASPLITTYQSAGLVLRLRLNHTTPKRRPA